MELYLPPTIAKLHQGTEFRTVSDAFKRRSEASKIKARKRWDAPGYRETFIDHSHAKAVDVFDLEGHYIATYPSARKATRQLGLPTNCENLVRKCRRGEKRQYRGFQFRDATPEHHDIDPVPPIRYGKTRRRGYHKDNSYLHKPCRVTFPDGDTMDFPSVGACAAALERRPSTVSTAIARGTRCRGFIIQFVDNQ